MAIDENSLAWNTADASSPAVTDQRGSRRPELGGFDIGAYELCNLDPRVTCRSTLAFCLDRVSLNTHVSPAGSGTILPALGTTLQCTGSVVTLVATPNPGYVFNGWTGNVSSPSTASTPLVMLEPQTVTANFVSCNCAVDVSGAISVARGPYVFNLGTTRFYQTVLLTNNSTNTITGPISLALDSLSADAILFNVTGITDSLEPPAERPYINVTAGNLAPGPIDFDSVAIHRSNQGRHHLHNARPGRTRFQVDRRTHMKRVCTFVALIGLAVVAAARAAEADSFDVSLNTSSLSGTQVLVFELTDGDGVIDNSVSLTDFSLVAAAWRRQPTILVPPASVATSRAESTWTIAACPSRSLPRNSTPVRRCRSCSPQQTISRVALPTDLSWRCAIPALTVTRTIPMAPTWSWDSMVCLSHRQASS
jgi:uncharacterized repeat protein (TIGR02543 family)